MPNRLFQAALFLSYTIIVVLATLLTVAIRERLQERDVAKNRLNNSQTRNIERYERFLTLTVGDYIAEPADTLLIEHAMRVIRNLEQIAKLSPFAEIRDRAEKLQAHYLTHFPMISSDELQLDLQEGDLIVRHNNSLHSEFFRKMGTREQKYSHIGIIHCPKSDSFLIVHTSANDFSGIGGIEAYPLHLFMPMGDFDVAIYRLKSSPQIRSQWVKEVLRLKEKRVPFDPFFDITDTTRLYCAEMLAYTLNKTLQREVIKPSGQFRGRLLYTIDDCYLIDEMECVYQRDGSVHSN